MAEQKTDGRTVQLKRVRLSFCDSLLHKKKTAKTEDAKEAHSVNVILEKDSPHYDANTKKIRKALDAASEEFWKGKPDKWRSIMEDDPKRVCYRKGDRFKNQTTGEIYDGYEGNWAIAGKGPMGGQKRPKLLDRRKREVETDDILDVFYAGTYADVIVSFYGTDKGGLGVFCSVEAIRSHEEGERMAGGFDVDPDVFDDLDDDDDGFSDSGSDDDEDDVDPLD